MPYILPQQPPRQTGWDQAGFATGVGIDFLLKALLAGQLGAKPTGGTFQAPTGATTNISPAERVAPGQAGAGRPLAQLLQQQPTGTFRGTGFGGLQIQPDVDRQLKQAQLQQTQATIPYYQEAAQQLGQSNQQVSHGVIAYLAKKALEGDAEADAQLQALGY